MRRVLGVLPDLRDLHIYGGLLLVGYGLGTWGWALVGLALWYLGVFRMKGA